MNEPATIGQVPSPRATSVRLVASEGVRRLIWVGFTLLLALVPGLTLLGASPDLDNYRIMYEWAAELDLAEVLGGSDPAYFLLSRSASALGMSFGGFLLLLAVLTCALHSRLLFRLRTDRITLLVLYLTYLFWLHDYTQIRFALALALVMLAIYRPDGWRWPLFIIGTAVHASVLLIVALHLILASRRAALLTAAGCVLAFVSGGLEAVVAGVGLRLATYQEFLAVGVFDEINRLSLMPIVQGLSLLACWPLLRRSGALARQEWWLAFCGLVGFYALASVPVFAFRIYEMFIPFFLILVSRVWRESLALQLLLPIYMLLGLRVSFLGPNALLPLL